MDAGFVVGEPFGHEGIYDFGGHGTLTKRVTQLGGVMMQHRCGTITSLRCTACKRRGAGCSAVLKEVVGTRTQACRGL